MFHLAFMYAYFKNIWFSVYNTLLRDNLSDHLDDKLNYVYLNLYC